MDRKAAVMLVVLFVLAAAPILAPVAAATTAKVTLGGDLGLTVAQEERAGPD